MRSDAVELEAKAETVFDSFETRLGSAVLAKLGALGKIENLIREWDGNGDGEISKIEFRQAVTGKSIGMKADNKDIDAFFSTMDDDGGGTISIAELKPALKMLQKKSLALEADAANLRAQAEGLRLKADGIEKLAVLTEGIEQDEAAHQEAQERLPVNVKLGAVITKRNLKVGELIAKWDKDGDGTVTMVEFRTNLIEMGVEADGADIDKLFISLDSDGGGSLDLEEVKKLFTSLQAEAVAMQRELKAKEASLKKSRQAVARQQAAYAAEQQREAQEARDADAAKKRAAADKLAAEEEARVAAKEAEERKTAKKAEDKKAMEERARERDVARRAALGAPGAGGS